MTRETAVVIAPGRGTYNKSELGYLHRWHPEKLQLLGALDAYRAARNLEGVTDLDGAGRYSLARHAAGKNAAGLIYGCALGDFLDIDRERYEIVAVTGNSMGWYLSLAAAGAIDLHTSGIELVETMAALMDENGTGGQLVYPLVDKTWQASAEHMASVERTLAANEGGLFVSIRLGGTVVLAGTDDALKAAEKSLPKIDERFPLRLARHAAFHTPLLAEVRRIARERLPVSLFESHAATGQALPLVDGRGEIWQPWRDLQALRDYTIGHQIVETYDFTRALEVALKEFAPQKLIILGPGTTLGPPVLQTLIANSWLGYLDRDSAMKRQEEDPFLLSMGIPEQRERVVRYAD